MSFTSWLRNIRSALAPSWINRKHRQRSLRTATHRPHVEALEDRCLLSFSPIATYPVGTNPIAVVMADFNNDSIQDLAVANYSERTVSVLLGNADGLGNPDGTFQPALTSATGANPQSLAVGDFDGDGILDLATANDGGYDVSVLLGIDDGAGAGTGAFEAPTSLGVGSTPTSVAVGDFNGDGNLDLGVTSNVYNDGYYGPGYWDYGYYPGTWYPGYYQGQANVLLGTGTGSFAAPIASDLGYGYHTSAAVANFNGDTSISGHPIQDFATVNSTYWTVSVLLGDSSGYLQGPTDFYTGYYPQSVAAGDVNGDGITDLVTRNNYSASVLLGNGSAGVGDGTFQSAQDTSLNFYPASLAVGDINDDGMLDIVTSSNVYTQIYDPVLGYVGFDTGHVNVLLGYGDGTFASPTDQPLDDGTFASGVAVGDVDGDGLPDVAVTNSDADSGNVTVLINAGDWILPASLAIGDVTVTEGDSGTVAAVFTVTRGGNLAGTVTVDYSTANGSAFAGSDYVAAGTTTLTFGPNETTKTITILVNGDLTNEYDEAFYVNLSAATGADIIDSQGVGTILDNDPLASLSIGDVTVTEGNGGTVAAVFTVTRGTNLGGTVTVNYSTANGGALAGSDYVAAGATLTFGPGETTKTITILVNGDLTDEYDQAFYVNLSAATGAIIMDSQGVGTILDNDPPPTITITTKVSAKEGNNNTTTTFNFIVTLSAASEKEVRVNFATANGTASTANNDYVANSGTLIFTPGQTSKTIPVVVKGDKLKESTETFFVNLSSATNATILGAQGIGEILDDDTPPKGRP